MARNLTKLSVISLMLVNLTMYGHNGHLFVVESRSMIVNIAEAKAQLSKLIDRVYHGEKVVIAKNNLPIADLVIHKPEGKRKLGLLKGRMKLPEDLLEPDTEIEEMFYGNGQ